MNKVHFSSKSDDWSTPQELFNQLDAIYGHFDLDVCADKNNTKCKKYYTKKDNGLLQQWHNDGDKIWMNPPYGRQIGLWVRKAFIESLHGATVVCLLPARTDTKWFHNYIKKAYDLIFYEGRIRFGGCKNAAPFPSMIVVFRGGTNIFEDD